jgi:capsid protein
MATARSSVIRSATNPLEQTITPATIAQLPIGKNIEFSNPPTVVEGNFDIRMLRKIAASIGVTYEDLTGDYSNVNFSSARMARLAHWANVYDWQWNMMVPRLCDPVWLWAMEMAYLAGGIGDMPAVEWTAQPMPMIDPDKEARAAILRVRGGMATPDHIVQEMGLDPDTFWPQYATSFGRSTS